MQLLGKVFFKKHYKGEDVLFISLKYYTFS